MKPDWKDAPEWAKWLAMDENHNWYWYENEPVLGTYVWEPEEGKNMYANHVTMWDNTLESRPSKHDEEKSE